MRRRLAMLGSDRSRGLVGVARAMLVPAGGIQLWELVVMSLAFGTTESFFRPAWAAEMPERLPPELWSKATVSAP
jgi:hypothetical protein